MIFERITLPILAKAVRDFNAQGLKLGINVDDVERLRQRIRKRLERFDLDDHCDLPRRLYADF